MNTELRNKNRNRKGSRWLGRTKEKRVLRRALAHRAGEVIWGWVSLVPLGWLVWNSSELIKMASCGASSAMRLLAERDPDRTVSTTLSGELRLLTLKYTQKTRHHCFWKAWPSHKMNILAQGRKAGKTFKCLKQKFMKISYFLCLLETEQVSHHQQHQTQTGLLWKVLEMEFVCYLRKLLDLFWVTLLVKPVILFSFSEMIYICFFVLFSWESPDSPTCPGTCYVD